MNVHYIKNGDIFASSCMAITNPVNSVGVMGAGLAKQFAKRYPEMCAQYNISIKAFFSSGEVLAPPTIMPARTKRWNYDKFVLMFPTKVHWRDESQLDYIDINMGYAVDVLNKLCIESIAFPMLGCGLGGLEWHIVEPVMMDRLKLYEGERVELYVQG